jgi:hypothetical protein
MSILSLLGSIQESNLYKLMYKNKPIGLRAKIFDLATNTFSYYDFELEIVGVDNDIKSYINSIHKDLSCIELIDKGNLLISQEELSNNIVIQEFKDSAQAIEIINKIRKLKENV